MTVEQPDDPGRPARRAGARAVAESDDGPPVIVERFWQSVLDYETAPVVTDLELLVRDGLDLPPPHALSDANLTAKMWQVIRQLAHRRTFLERTNHLSDRELYGRLWCKWLRDEHLDLPVDESNAWHIDLLGGRTDEDVYLEHKFYATDEERRDWLESFPDYAMPAHEDPPFDRDRYLPKAEYRPLAGPDDTRTGDGP
jgi:hypothetical protein